MTNRETATVIWLTIFLLWAATRPNVRESFARVLRTFAQVKIQIPLLLFVAYIVAWIWLAEKAGFWGGELLKDTILWILLSGLPLLFNFDQAGSDETYFRRTVLAVLEMSVLLDFFLNIVSFSLVTELVLQPVLVLLGVMIALAGAQKQYASVKRLCELLLFAIGSCLIAATAVDIYGQREDLDFSQLWHSLLLLVWLPMVALPFIYGMALFAGFELAFLRMKYFNDRRPVSIKFRLALLIGLRASNKTARRLGSK